jgi:hypothetical protein
MTFDDWDGSQGWVRFLERKGIAASTQTLYYHLFAHCSIQAAATEFDAGTRRAMTHGAVVEAFSIKPDGYDFETTYTTLEAALTNLNHQFDYLPNPNVGVLNAKYLIENFVIPNMKNSNAFIDDFQLYSGTVCQGVSIARRAIVQLSKSAKI